MPRELIYKLCKHISWITGD